MSTPDRLIKRPEVCRVAGLSPSTLYRRIQTMEGPGARFPRPIRTGPRSSRWSENAVLDWIAQQKVEAGSVQ